MRVNRPIPTKVQYPRVLMVLMTKVKADDPVNLLIRTQFGDWPKEHLAQIHSNGETSGNGEFCRSYYSLQACDRFLGVLFRRLRGDVMEMVAADPVVMLRKDKPAGVLRGWTKSIKKRWGDWLIDSGLWELIFHVRLSKRMEQFVERFKPDLIYCQGYSLGFATLPLLIAKRFGIPICFQTTDDWPHAIYSHSPVGWLLRRRADELIKFAKIRLAFGQKMQKEYERRYCTPFETTYHLDDPKRFPSHTEDSSKIFKIIYTGGLGHRRFEAIQDLLVAIRQIPELAGCVEIIIHSSGIPKEMPTGLLQSREVIIVPLPTHEQLPAILAQAALLFLPESFNADRQAIEYSISTKAHLYMMSGRPILVYGPAFSGTVEYALREEWGLVVAERSGAKLKEALAELLVGSERIYQLKQNANSCVSRHHDLAVGRDRFRNLMVDAYL